MREELGQIDLSPIADLVRIKGEEQILADRLGKMDGQKAKVSGVVYQRVRRDYETRRAALEAESRPLKERARREYAKLQVLRGRAEKAVEEASLQKEELDFRHELGEFPDQQFRESLADCEKKLADRRADLDAVAETRAKFITAFRSEEELEGPALPAPESEATVLEPAAAPFPPSADATVLEVAPPRQPSPESTAPEPPAPLRQALAAEPPQATVVLAMPRIVMLVNDQPGEEHMLKTGTTVFGRSPKSDIELPFSDVSRRHAQIIWDTGGYVVLDLGSENGVFVNGEKIKKRALADGDVIQIGPQKMVFRA